MAEDRSTDRSSGETNEIGAEGGKRRRKRLLVGEVKLCENEAGGGAVEEKVIPLDGGANRRCDDRLAQLCAVFGVG